MDEMLRDFLNYMGVVTFIVSIAALDCVLEKRRKRLGSAATTRDEEEGQEIQENVAVLGRQIPVRRAPSAQLASFTSRLPPSLCRNIAITIPSNDHSTADNQYEDISDTYRLAPAPGPQQPLPRMLPRETVTVDSNITSQPTHLSHRTMPPAYTNFADQHDGNVSEPIRFPRVLVPTRVSSALPSTRDTSTDQGDRLPTYEEAMQWGSGAGGAQT